MKNYAVLADLRAKATFHIEKAFDRGYDQGYHDGKLDGEAENIEMLEKQFDDEKKAEYKRGYADGKKEVAAELNFEKGYYKGYEDGKTDIVSKAKAEVSQYREGYDKGLEHGQELRAEEVKCAEACGLRKGWETARKILQMTLDEVAKVFDPTWDVEHIIEKLSAKEVIEKLEAWEKKQEQNEKSCENCGHHRSGDVGCEAGGCSLIRENWIPQEKQDAPEMNVESIENRDKIVKALAGLLAAYGEQLWDVVADMEKNP